MECTQTETRDPVTDHKLKLLCKELEEETNRFLVKVEQLEKLLERVEE
jgi:hypothetical protein